MLMDEKGSTVQLWLTGAPTWLSAPFRTCLRRTPYIAKAVPCTTEQETVRAGRSPIHLQLSCAGS